eukprot:Nk52_evm17s1636 gene=Nk52_evmTU17s1636
MKSAFLLVIIFSAFCCLSVQAGSGYYLKFINHNTFDVKVTGVGAKQNDCWSSYDLDKETVVPAGKTKIIYTEEDQSAGKCDFKDETYHNQGFRIYNDEENMSLQGNIWQVVIGDVIKDATSYIYECKDDDIYNCDNIKDSTFTFDLGYWNTDVYAIIDIQRTHFTALRADKKK